MKPLAQSNRSITLQNQVTCASTNMTNGEMKIMTFLALTQNLIPIISCATSLTEPEQRPQRSINRSSYLVLLYIACLRLHGITTDASLPGVSKIHNQTACYFRKPNG